MRCAEPSRETTQYQYSSVDTSLIYNTSTGKDNSILHVTIYTLNSLKKFIQRFSSNDKLSAVLNEPKKRTVVTDR